MAAVSTELMVEEGLTIYPNQSFVQGIQCNSMVMQNTDLKYGMIGYM